jgi:hypothetical protein
LNQAWGLVNNLSCPFLLRLRGRNHLQGLSRLHCPRSGRRVLKSISNSITTVKKLSRLHRAIPSASTHRANAGVKAAPQLWRAPVRGHNTLVNSGGVCASSPSKSDNRLPPPPKTSAHSIRSAQIHPAVPPDARGRSILALSHPSLKIPRFRFRASQSIIVSYAITQMRCDHTQSDVLGLALNLDPQGLNFRRKRHAQLRDKCLRRFND